MYRSYGRLSAGDVKPGDKVKAGAIVGKTGNTGSDAPVTP
ncbi:M23 family metallopeptidase [Brevibacterium sp. p3-SID960]|nr:M23 family metallopeptidase [Brevibacterium sp. p3-SID960]